MILEEAAYIRPELVYQVVLPVLSTGASLIAISTIAPEEDNLLKTLVNAKNTRGQPVIRCINLKMVCDRCIRLGKELTCPHLLGQIPRWQEKGRHADVQALMKTQQDTFLVEMRGTESNMYSTPAFDRGGVMALRDSSYKPDGSDIRQIFIGIDPAAGGAKSEYAILSVFYTNSDQMVLCGAEAGSWTETSDCCGALINHILAIREQVPGGKNAHIVIVPESNLAMEALWAWGMIQRSGIHDICTMREDANKVGVRTSKATKVLMALALNFKIVRRNVFIMDNFVSVSDDNRTGEDMRDALVDQLKQYMKHVKPPRDPKHNDATVSYSGKSGGFDDLAIAVQLVNMLQPRFWSDETQYGRWH